MSIFSVGGRCPRCRYPLNVNTIHVFRPPTLLDKVASTKRTVGRAGRVYECFRCGWKHYTYRNRREFGKGTYKDGPRWTAPQ